MSMDEIYKIAQKFNVSGPYLDYKKLNNGHINDTFLLRTKGRNSKTGHYTVQKINDKVFKDPYILMKNIERVSNCLKEKNRKKVDSQRRFLNFLPSINGKYCYKVNGAFWRVYKYVNNVKTYNAAESYNIAYEGAKTFGNFVKSLSDLPGDPLYNIIPDFHNTPKRLNSLIEAFDSNACGRAEKVKEEFNFIISRKDDCRILKKLADDGTIPERITHNDTKINNVLFDEETNKGICVIDLDTVMPGIIHYDFGDMIRTFCTTAEEDEKDLNKVSVDLKLFRGLCDGFISVSNDFLSEKELEYLAFSGKLISMEVGIRFLTDYLNGDQYFKIKYPEHNYHRAANQLALAKSIENNLNEMNQIVRNSLLN